ncbi:MAG: hypothetical protein IPL61_08445 [Myxococcales bacterium]|nr:hypothetical protein [Myxococcales bacterium]
MNPRGSAALIVAAPMAALIVAALAGCQRAPVRTCDDDLGGVWRGADGDYQLLDSRGRLELYPLHDELPRDLPPGVVAAPAVVDLARAGAAPPSGTVTRRYERGAQFCRVSRPARLRRCADARLELEVTRPTPPVDWTACTAAPGPPIVIELARVR